MRRRGGFLFPPRLTVPTPPAILIRNYPLQGGTTLPWKKANQNLIQLLQKTVVKYPCDRRFMFGSPPFFINGNMFAGVHEDTVILRLSDADRAGLFARHREAVPFTPMGRPMKEYAALPESLCKNATVFNDFLERSFKYAASLTAKTPRRKTRKT